MVTSSTTGGVQPQHIGHQTTVGAQTKGTVNWEGRGKINFTVESHNMSEATLNNTMQTVAKKLDGLAKSQKFGTISVHVSSSGEVSVKFGNKSEAEVQKEIGDLRAQIDNLKEKIGKKETLNKDAEGDVQTLRDAGLNDAANKLSSELKDELKEMQGQKGKLESQLNRLENRMQTVNDIKEQFSTAVQTPATQRSLPRTDWRAKREEAQLEKLTTGVSETKPKVEAEPKGKELEGAQIKGGDGEVRPKGIDSQKPMGETKTDVPKQKPTDEQINERSEDRKNISKEMRFTEQSYHGNLDSGNKKMDALFNVMYPKDKFPDEKVRKEMIASSSSLGRAFIDQQNLQAATVKIEGMFKLADEHPTNNTTERFQAFVAVYTSPEFKTYSELTKKSVMNYSDALTDLQQLSNNKKTPKAVIAHIRENNLETQLPNSLICPIQRMPRHKLLMEDLLKKSPEGMPGYEAGQTALDEIKKLATLSNEAMRGPGEQKKFDELKESMKSKKPKVIASKILTDFQFDEFQTTSGREEFVNLIGTFAEKNPKKSIATFQSLFKQLDDMKTTKDTADQMKLYGVQDKMKGSEAETKKNEAESKTNETPYEGPMSMATMLDKSIKKLEESVPNKFASDLKNIRTQFELFKKATIPTEVKEAPKEVSKPTIEAKKAEEAPKEFKLELKEPKPLSISNLDGLNKKFEIQKEKSPQLNENEAKGIIAFQEALNNPMQLKKDEMEKQLNEFLPAWRGDRDILEAFKENFGTPSPELPRESVSAKPVSQPKQEKLQDNIEIRKPESEKPRALSQLDVLNEKLKIQKEKHPNMTENNAKSVIAFQEVSANPNQLRKDQMEKQLDEFLPAWRNDELVVASFEANFGRPSTPQ